MLIAFIILGYLFIAAVIMSDVRKVSRRCKFESRLCFGKRSIYLRERKTGRLIGCSLNIFTLILQGTES
jgi:hypothetical protein